MKKDINVLFIVDKSGFGGVQTITNDLINKDFWENINIYYFFLRDIDKRYRTKQKLKKNVFYSKTRSKYNFSSLIELRKIIKEKNIEILHMNGDKSTIYGILIKKLLFKKIKLIHHEHSGIFRKELIYNKILNYFKDDIDLFLAVSKTTAKELIKKSDIPENKIKVLYNFVNLDKFNRKNIRQDIQKQKEKLGIKKRDFVIGYVGRLNKIKGVNILIKSIPLIGEKIKNLKVIIAGEGVERKNLEELVKKLRVEDKVIFLGYVSHPVNVYILLNVLVMPSLTEAFGISVIEARAIGIPVVASNIGGLKEITKNKINGLLFDKENSRDLTKKINLLYEDLKLRKKISRNSIVSAKRFSIEKYQNLLKEIYKNV